MSFSLTEPQLLNGTKDVTRRMGWMFLLPGHRVRGVRKAMGLKKGEKVHVLGVIEVLSARREPLRAITPEDVIREGFPGMSPAAFVEMFCASHSGCEPQTSITRIEFKFILFKDLT